MFGYVTADTEKLSKERLKVYRGVYCGVCRSLRDRHGIRTELALSYDMVFLALLLMSVYGEEAEALSTRCVPHPGKKHGYYRSPVIDYAADMGLLLTYFKLLDDWQDDKNAARYLESRLIRAKARQVEKRYPRQAEKIRGCLAELANAEKRDEREPDIPARAFGALMGELFVLKKDDLAPLLWETGNRLGMFIYLCDAALDLKEDLKRKRYNPLTGLSGDGFYSSLCAVMGQCCACYRQLPVDKNRDILDNILYSGVWIRWNQAHASRKSEKADGPEGDAPDRTGSRPEGGSVL